MIISCPACSTRFSLPDVALGAKPRKVHCSRCGHIWMQRPEDAQPDPRPARRPAGGPPAAAAAAAKKAPLKKKKKKKAPAPPPPAPENDDSAERFPGMGGYAHDDHATVMPSGHGEAMSGDDVWAALGNHNLDMDIEPPSDRRSLMERARDLGRWIGFAAGIVGLVVFVLADRMLIVGLWPAAARLYAVVGVPVEPPGAGLQFQNIKSEQRVDNGTTILVLEGQIANVSTTDRPVPPVVATSLGPDHQPVKSWRVTVTQDRLAPGAIATFRSQERDPGTVGEISVTFATEGGGSP